jgi:hypothetical protein
MREALDEGPSIGKHLHDCPNYPHIHIRCHRTCFHWVQWSATAAATATTYYHDDERKHDDNINAGMRKAVPDVARRVSVPRRLLSALVADEGRALQPPR